MTAWTGDRRRPVSPKTPEPPEPPEPQGDRRAASRPTNSRNGRKPSASWPPNRRGGRREAVSVALDTRGGRKAASLSGAGPPRVAPGCPGGSVPDREVAS
ncbi:MAG: hypothetical protein LBQ12_13910 [Deltaproteobacteria bacterium]|nr:hypothetical protein [Deltaproteobacteria bacterium]